MNADRDVLDALDDLHHLPVPATDWAAGARGRARGLRRRRLTAVGAAGITLAAAATFGVVSLHDSGSSAAVAPAAAACTPNGNPVWVPRASYPGPGEMRLAPGGWSAPSAADVASLGTPVGKPDVLLPGAHPMTIGRGRLGGRTVYIEWYKNGAGTGGAVTALPRDGLTGGSAPGAAPAPDSTEAHQTFQLVSPTLVEGTVGIGVDHLVITNAASCERTTVRVVGKELGLAVGWFAAEQRGAGPVTIDAYDSAGHQVATKTDDAWPPKPTVVPRPLGYSRTIDGKLIKAK